MAANAVGQNTQAEAQIRCRTTATNNSNGNASATNGHGYANADTVGTGAAPMGANDPRRQSTASAMSSTTAASPTAMDSQLGGLMPNCVVDSHIPHMICKFCAFLLLFHFAISNMQPGFAGLVTLLRPSMVLVVAALPHSSLAHGRFLLHDNAQLLDTGPSKKSASNWPLFLFNILFQSIDSARITHPAS